MSVKFNDLLTFYSSAMHEGDAALFIGSGMSRPAGFVDWKGLLAKLALEIDLDVEREHDLVELAQFYLNRKRDRSALNQALIDEFHKPGALTVNHPILARLPVSTIWTTNFDALIEEALRKANKRVDVKSHDRDIGWRIQGRAVVVYKMHGDIQHPQELVICKDDYEGYPKTHPIFQNALEGDLVTKTFLFLGFSFSDPNLSYMLGQIRSILQESKRRHFAVMRRVRLSWDIKDSNKAHKDFDYETAKQIHQIENLQRYSIYTHLLENYKDITKVLEAVENKYAQRIIYLWTRESPGNELRDMAELCRRLGERVIHEEFKLCCDLDTRLGRAACAGAKSKIDEKHLYPLERYLLRPMPTNKSQARHSTSEFASASRKEMIRRSGFVIFLGGSETDYVEIKEDFESALAMNAVPIPVGTFGSAARIIWERISHSLDSVYGKAVSMETFQQLNSNYLDNVVDAIIEIIDKTCSREPEPEQKFQISQSERRNVYDHLVRKFPDLPDKTRRRIVGNL